MKRKLVPAIIMLSLVTSTMWGCGKTEEAEAPVQEEIADGSDVQESSDSEEEEVVGMPNPMVEATFDEIVEATGVSVILPDNMENPEYYMINNEIGQVSFTLDNGNTNMTYRVQKTDEFTDISGMYYEWTNTSEGTLLDYEDKELSYSGSDGDVQVILWYNQYSGLMNSLSADAKDLDGFDLYGYAFNMVMTDVPLENCPSNNLEERSGKTEFDSYDEIIGLLADGEAYSLVNIKGYDGEVLLIAEEVYDNQDGNMASIMVYPYTKKSFGKVTFDTLLSSQGTAYPISIDDNGLVYCGGHSEVNVYCYGENGTDNPGLMLMNFIFATDFDEEGMPTKVSGFYRDITQSSSAEDDTVSYAEEDVEALNTAFAGYEAAKPVNFTKP